MIGYGCRILNKEGQVPRETIALAKKESKEDMSYRFLLN